MCCGSPFLSRGSRVTVDDAAGDGVGGVSGALYVGRARHESVGRLADCPGCIVF